MSLMNSLIKYFNRKGIRNYHNTSIDEYKKVRENEIKAVRFCKLSKKVKVNSASYDTLTLTYFTKTSNDQNKIIYYIHGGGFVCGSTKARVMFTNYLANKLGYNVASIDYPLAPEHPFPEGIDACLLGYKELLKTYKSKDIVLIGESAGGNLVLSLLLKIKENNLPFPLTTFSFSPCVQFEKDLDSYIKNAKKEACVGNLNEEVNAVYLKGNKSLLKNPFVSPIYGDFKGCSPVYIFVSEDEKLFDDSKLIYEVLNKQNVQVTLNIRKDMIHTWIIIPYIKEAKKDLKKVKEMIENDAKLK